MNEFEMVILTQLTEPERVDSGTPGVNGQPRNGQRSRRVVERMDDNRVSEVWRGVARGKSEGITL